MNLFNFSVWAVIIQFLGSLAIAAYVFAAILSLIFRCNVYQARLLVAEGVVTSLNFMVAATLLKTINLRTWRQILVFSLILSIRIFLKKLFVWEKMQILTIKSRV
ncbi:DUF1622 domain-containing protein [Nostoc sp. UCD121]|uniref:DUF1622 domain-containing protein n=1 Tax=unclassified Nostoc TaxID=2593658 RepID=UPI001623A87D|nr:MULTISPECIES: DUF1622 domain-containing protein [unclassified Nostoc]MBC1225291.1 DUF1622 domain-containing protein [Nostoc sp. UCD120]MBC1277869.1 DUF1622 domain-containing protein [Nostoc sp. UCD121]MBC1297557.1 DUF1622 domain-containing protein [Nostoc sp. UCD122]